LYDIEYLVSPAGKRVAAFGYWAGYAGAAVTMSCWVSQKLKKSSKVFAVYNDKDSLDEQIRNESLPKILKSYSNGKRSPKRPFL
jgi:saccharopine dehydrogenase (NAD+, L-lysine-forming)